MTRLFLFALVSLALVSCSGSRYFRSLSREEKTAIKTAKKPWKGKRDANRVLIMTDSGNMVVRLYDQTPLHRDNFMQKVKAGFFDSLLFHRVIKNFMIQGGDPESKHADSLQPLGMGEASGGRIPAEIRTSEGIYHKKGVIAAARDNNPEKASSNCQFYIAQGRIFTPLQLDSAQKARGYTLNDSQRKLYTTVGGIPHLDGNYTIFGELENGLETLDKIAATRTNLADRPLKDIRMKMFVVSERK